MTLSTSLVFVVSCISRVIQYCKLCTQPCVVPNQYEFQKKIFKKYHHQSQYGSVLFWTPLSFIVWKQLEHSSNDLPYVPQKKKVIQSGSEQHKGGLMMIILFFFFVSELTF